MPNIATRVLVNSNAADILYSLASKSGRPKAQIVGLALKELEEKTFWADVQNAFSRAAGDPADSARAAAAFGVRPMADDDPDLQALYYAKKADGGLAHRFLVAAQ